MGKAVMISIRPEWCEKIKSGEKTIEARKSYPKLETPFKCYIYETRGACFSKNPISGKEYYHGMQGSGAVIGEYVCDKMVWVVAHPSIFAGHTLLLTKAIKAACLTNDEAERYSGGKNVFGWCISQVKIYDKPRDLVEFCRPCDRVPGSDCRYCKRHGGHKPILSPPQSWCYVEEVAPHG